MRAISSDSRKNSVKSTTATKEINDVQGSEIANERVAQNWLRPDKNTNQDQWVLLLWKIRHCLKSLNQCQAQNFSIHKISSIDIYMSPALWTDETKRRVNIYKQLLENHQDVHFLESNLEMKRANLMSLNVTPTNLQFRIVPSDHHTFQTLARLLRGQTVNNWMRVQAVAEFVFFCI